MHRLMMATNNPQPPPTATPATHHIRGKRSFTGNHSLLPATHPPARPDILPDVPSYTFVTWTFGRGSVISKIWPAMLLHTLFAAGVVYVWVSTGQKLGIPNMMLTVLGVVIGFVISYRASTSYDRYWTGRTAWSDVVRNTRTLGRMIWYHTPLRLSSRLPEEPIGARRSEAEMKRVMHEKKMALDLVEGFAVALKHHLRNEQGIYYEDLYDLIKPLHDHYHSSALSNPLQQTVLSPTEPGAYGTFAAAASALRATSHASKRPANPSSVSTSTPHIVPPSDPTTAESTNAASSSAVLSTSENPSLVSLVDAHTPLLPASNPGPQGSAPFRRVAPDIIPFAGLFSSLRRALSSSSAAPDTPNDATGEARNHRRTWRGPVHPEPNARRRWKAARERNALNARVARLVYEGHDLDALAELRRDNKPDDEAGENLPAEILRCLSEWVAVLEERGSVPSTTISSIIAGIQALEISLTLTEQVLTTPLPFVYSVHIRVVWLYLFLLPLQLVNAFAWHTVPAVSVAAFVYLGFVAAGEEIEQPFGYDDNDLDLDLLCRDIVRRDIQSLKRAPCANAWLGAGARVGLDYHREAEAEMRAANVDDKKLAFTAAGIHIVPTVEAPVDPADESVVASGVDVVDSRTHGVELSPFGSGTELVHRTSAMAVVSSSMDGV